jgi:ADP-heptose:LPS heptosyltransferase
MRIVISPFSKVIGTRNAKNYPYWQELIDLLRNAGHYIIQINPGYEPELKVDEVKKNLNMRQLKELLDSCDTWISVDNFFQHFANYYKKKGFVIFGKSDPNIFGHKENVNILKDKKYLRNNQFDVWKNEKFESEVFPEAKEVYEIINGIQERI